MKMMKPVLMIVCLALLVAGKPVTPNYEVGDTVADFKAKNIDGKTVTLSGYKNAKGIILIFDCNTCPVSKAYNSRIKALHESYAKQGFPVVAVNPNSPDVSQGDSFDEMVKYARKNDFKHDYLYDETQNIAKAFGATNTPHVFILKKDGSEFKVAYIGAIDNNRAAPDKKYVEEAVDALLAGKAVPTAKTKAVGCGIKWKDA